MRVLGVDFGLRKLGLALSDERETIATPRHTLTVSTVRDAPGAVAAAAKELQAAAIVVGVPEGLEGEERRREMLRVKRFARALRKETGLPVRFVDESMSSREASARRRAASGGGAGGRGGASGRRRADRDLKLHALAAAVILQRWLDRPRPAGERAP